MRRIRVGLFLPKLSGHEVRGTGEYTKQLFAALQTDERLDVREVVHCTDTKDYDVVHYPYFDPFFFTFPFFKTLPSVVTVHDLIPFRFPDQFSPGIRGWITWHIQRMSLRSVSSILTDSTASKTDIIRFTGVCEQRITVVPLGVGKDFRVLHEREYLMKVKQKYVLPDFFVLFVGDVNYNKNVSGLLMAFQLARKRQQNLHLVLVGSGFGNPSRELDAIKQHVRDFGIAQWVHFVGFVDHRELIAIYNLARCYIQPSLAEGFGLPVLEAMACGVGVVCSHATSLPEVGRDAAVYVDPKNEYEMSMAIVRMCSDASFRSEYRERGLRRARECTWETSAARVSSVYRDVVSRSITSPSAGSVA